MVLVVNNLPANAGDTRDAGSIPGSDRSPGGGHGNPLQYSCLENPMDRGAWWAIVHGVAQSWTWMKWLSTCIHRLLRKHWDGENDAGSPSGWDLDISYCGGQGRKQDWEGETGELCSEIGTWVLQNYSELWWRSHGFVLLDEPVSGCRLAPWGNSSQLRQFPKKAERERLWKYSTVSCWIQTLESLRSQAQHRSCLQFSLEWENGRREEERMGPRAGLSWR